MTHINGHRTTQRTDSSHQNSRAADAAATILRYARAEIGFREGANNANKYAGFAGHANNQFWCSTFVTWALKKAGQDGAQLPPHALRAVNSGQAGAAVETFRDAYQAAGKVYRPGSQTPQPGDLVFFGGDGGKHIGIVERVQDGKVYTIEGNSSDSVARRSYPLNGSSIWGFGRTFGESIPPDAQLGGPAELQASVGGGSWTDGGGSATNSVTSSGGGQGSSGTSSVTSSGGGQGSTGTSSYQTPSASAPVNISNSSPSVSSLSTLDLMFWINLLAMYMPESVEDSPDLMDYLKKNGVNVKPGMKLSEVPKQLLEGFLAQKIKKEAGKLGDDQNVLPKAVQNLTTEVNPTSAPVAGGDPSALVRESGMSASVLEGLRPINLPRELRG